LQAQEVDAFIERARIVPGTLEHLYPDPRGGQPGRGQHHEEAHPGAEHEGQGPEDNEDEPQVADGGDEQ